MAGKRATNIYGSVIHYRHERMQDTRSDCDVSIFDLSTGSSYKISAGLVALLAIGAFYINQVHINELTVLLMVLGIIVYLYTGIGQCESVTVISDVGVQVWHRKWLVWSSTVFVPHTLIDGVIINEAILRHRVVFYLAILIKTTTPSSEDKTFSDVKILPLFTDIMPRLDTLKEVYHAMKTTLRIDN